MSLLSVVQGVCAVVGVEIPQSVFANFNANRTMQEMVSVANEMAQRIAYDAGRDWTMLRTTIICPGDGNTASFGLQSNYKRLLLTTQVRRSTSPTTPMRFISDFDEWIERRMNQTEDACGEWIIYGGQIHIRPILAATETAHYSYLDRNIIRIASGGIGETFLADGDGFRLDERLLKLGMIYQWKASKGSPYAEDMGSFSDALAMEMGHDKPSPIIGRKPQLGPSVYTDVSSWSWPLGGGMVPP